MEGFTHEIGRAHPAVQVDGRTPRHQAMVAGVDEIRTALEGGHRQPAPGQRRHDRQADRGLAAAALGRGYQKPFYTREIAFYHGIRHSRSWFTTMVSPCVLWSDLEEI